MHVACRSIVVVMDPGEQSQHAEDVLRANRSREKRFAFHHAMDGKNSNEDVYNNTAKPVIDGVLDGINATIFAYGATGTGKTYTMIGNTENPGITVLVLRDLFELMKTNSGENDYRVCMSYLEIYNETIRDLLEPDGKDLDLREDPVRGLCLVGISEVNPRDTGEVMELLQRGNKYRTTESTDANQASSRSHALMQIRVEQSTKSADIQTEVRVSKLSMIDLAGSERASATNNRGLRMVEGANINRSLLALGNCINALGVNDGDVKFVPYRDSKLTRLLKDSLGGSCRTVMIATLSPCASSYEENINTLKYASRATNIRNKVTRNIVQVSHHIAEYTAIIQELREEVNLLRQQMAAIQSGQPVPVDPVAGKQVESLQEEVYSNFSERLLLLGNLAEIQEEAAIEAIGNKLDQGPLAGVHTPGGTRLLPDINHAQGGRVATPLIWPMVLGFEADDKQREVKSSLEDNEHTIGEVQKKIKKAGGLDESTRERLTMLCDMKLLEATNLELKRDCRISAITAQQNSRYIEMLEDQLRERDAVFHAHADDDARSDAPLERRISGTRHIKKGTEGQESSPRLEPRNGRSPESPKLEAVRTLKRRISHRRGTVDRFEGGLGIKGKQVAADEKARGLDGLPGGGGGTGGGMGEGVVRQSYAAEHDRRLVYEAYEAETRGRSNTMDKRQSAVGNLVIDSRVRPAERDELSYLKQYRARGTRVRPPLGGGGGGGDPRRERYRQGDREDRARDLAKLKQLRKNK